MAVVAAVTHPSPLRAGRAFWILTLFFGTQFVVGVFLGVASAIYSTAAGAARTAWSVGFVLKIPRTSPWVARNSGADLTFTGNGRLTL